jgi:hypothetical protein
LDGKAGAADAIPALAALVKVKLVPVLLLEPAVVVAAVVVDIYDRFRVIIIRINGVRYNNQIIKGWLANLWLDTSL